MSITHISFLNIRKMAFATNQQTLEPKSNQLSPTSINIFCGQNGSGKSTIIDIIRTIEAPHKLAYIARENMNADTTAQFEIKFNNDTKIYARFISQGIGAMYIGTIIFKDKNKHIHEAIVKTNKIKTFPPEYEKNINLLQQRVAYRSSHDLHGAPLDMVIEILNKDAKHFLGTTASGLKSNANKYSRPENKELITYIKRNCFHKSEHLKNCLSIWLHDDELQTNQVHLNDIPAGWKAFAGLLVWLSLQKNKTICLIEEPEIHLHPHLQRIIIKRLQEIAKTKQLQLFISTHSTTFLEYGAWYKNMTNIYEMDGYGIRNLSRSADFLTSMGIRPSEIFLANGLVWIEGVSDRIYIKHWIKLYCEKNKIDEPVENLDYAFIPYGGAMLKHYSADRNNTIQTMMINKNCIFVADRDNDYDMSTPETPILLNNKTAKEDIRKNLPTWITEGYTIENYLPTEILNHFFDVSTEKTALKNGRSKVNCALYFEEKCNDFDHSYIQGSNLQEMIEYIINNIKRWNN